MLHVMAGGVLLLAFTGCTSSVVVRPTIEPQTIGNFHIPAKVVFDGNRDYLPRVIQDSVSGDDTTIADYHYDVSTKRSNFDSIALFNPLSLVGFPSGNNQLTLFGELKILRHGALIKTYRAISAVDQQTGLWSFQTLTDLRREGLIAVRDNIDAQLVLDRKFIESVGPSP